MARKKRPGGGATGGGAPGGKGSKGGNPGQLARDLLARMEAADTAERLNDEVLIPFITALEKVCGARGYVLNVYGETANLIFTGDPDDAERIYQLVDDYLEDDGTG